MKLPIADSMRIVYYNAEWWKTGDRVQMLPHGNGSITRFIHTDRSAIVRFDNPGVGQCRVRLSDLERIAS